MDPIRKRLIQEKLQDPCYIPATIEYVADRMADLMLNAVWVEDEVTTENEIEYRRNRKAWREHKYQQRLRGQPELTFREYMVRVNRKSRVG